MIRLWLSRKAAIPIYQQLTSQFVLGILSRRLTPGEKLPSVRELARRLKIHPNTVSAAYRLLASRGWVDQRRGSGVFVRPRRSLMGRPDADAYAQSCFEEGVARGYSREMLRLAFDRCAHPGEEKLVVVDPDPELARILAMEISEATRKQVQFAAYEDAGGSLKSSTCVLITERFARTNPELLRTCAIQIVQLKSMQEILDGRERALAPILLAVVSSSETILRWARMLLAALGFPPDSVLLRNPRKNGWRDGLLTCDLIAADAICIRELGSETKIVEFRIVASEFLEQLSPALSREDLRLRHSVGRRNTSS